MSSWPGLSNGRRPVESLPTLVTRDLCVRSSPGHTCHFLFHVAPDMTLRPQIYCPRYPATVFYFFGAIDKPRGNLCLAAQDGRSWLLAALARSVVDVTYCKVE